MTDLDMFVSLLKRAYSDDEKFENIIKLSKKIKFESQINFKNLNLFEFHYNGEVWYLAKNSEKIIGFIVLKFLENIETIYIELVYIFNNFRGLNFGRNLIGFSKDIGLKNSNFSYIRAHPDETYSSKRFFLKKGFKSIGDEVEFKLKE